MPDESFVGAARAARKKTVSMARSSQSGSPLTNYARFPRSTWLPEPCRGPCGSVSPRLDGLHKPHRILRVHRWAIRELNSATFQRGTNRRELFHQLERALVLCEFIYHGKDDKECRLLGQRSKSEVLQSATGNRFGVLHAFSGTRKRLAR